MKKFHFSTAECFENCPCRYLFRYVEELEVVESDDPANPLKIGTALHRGMETDVETALKEYFMSYPIIADEHITEAIKLQHWIPKVKELVPEGLHEMNIQSDWYEGTMDLLVPCTKHDAELPHGQFDLYDYKYSNNQQHYMESRQLHVYKYFCEKITGKRIRKMFFVFVPKTSIKQKKTESIEEFRDRVLQELKEQNVEVKEVIYDPNKVLEFFNICMKIQYAEKFPKEQSYLCNWCEYQDYCLKGDTTMLLPKAERRQIGKTVKRRIWIYGQPFSGKTTFVDSAPMPINLNSDGNIQQVSQQYLSIKDTYEGRIKKLGWEVFKEAIAELEKGDNEFKTIVVDLLEDMYESCRLYCFETKGFEHESDAGFGKGWDIVRTEFLSTIRKLVNLDYENIILISHEDTAKDITKKSGDKITAIKPNIAEKVANKIAGMVDVVARVVVEDDGRRTLNFKSNEVVFGGGRLKGITKTCIPLDWSELCKVYDEANGADSASQDDHREVKKEKVDNLSSEQKKAENDDSVKSEVAKVDKGTGMVVGEDPDFMKFDEPEEKQEEEPKRRRRTRKERKDD